MAIKKPDERVDRYLQLYLLRRNDDSSEEEIASNLGFGSPQALYQQLRADNHPVCPLCRELPVEDKHCEPLDTPKRKARKGGSEALQLPPAANALKLIRCEIEGLLFPHVIGQLERREERLEAGRFVVEQHEDADSIGWTAIRYRRENWPDEDWLRFCEEVGEDPKTDEVQLVQADRRRLEGASRVPPEPLRKLIGVYVLGGGSLEELLATLHPDPASVDRDRLAKMVDRLKVENGRIATLVRGGDPKTGRGPEEITMYDHTAAAYINRRRMEGIPDRQIREELSGDVPSPPETPFPPLRITQEEYGRLAGLNLT